MAIKEEKIWVSLISNNILYWEEKGYEIPRYYDVNNRFVVKIGTKIEVKVKDLQIVSHKKITRICDICGKISENIEYRKIIQSRGINDNLDLCSTCNKYRSWNNFRDNLKFEESLEYLFPEIALEWNYERNINIKPLNVTPKSGIKVWWKCKECEYEWETTVNSRYKGRDRGVSCIECYHKINRGENHYKWKPLKTDEERLIQRKYYEYEKWRIAVYKRDIYTCQCCGDSNGGNLNAHHKDGYDWCIERRTDEDNGVTLCKECHSDFHYIYGFGDNTEAQYNEWISEAKEDILTNELIKLNINIAM